MKLGFCPIGNGDSISPFDEIFTDSGDISKEGLDGCDAVVFWGGTDVHPSFYGEKAHMKSQAQYERPSMRDEFERKAMLACIARGIPMIGVCRGAQLMCAVAGGSIIQDVTDHNISHGVLTSTGESFLVSSAHHQMMNPWDVPHTLLAWSSKPLSRHYQDGKHQSVPEMKQHPEPEIVYFPKIKGLAIQGHPEWVDPTTPFTQYCNKAIMEYLFSDVVVQE